VISWFQNFALKSNLHRYIVVLDDAEFFDAQEPFTLGEQRGVAVTVNTLVVRTHLSKGSGYGKIGTVAGGGARLMVGLALFTTLFCSQSTVQLMEAKMVHVTSLTPGE
jgi:hypothetical protein